MIVWKFVRSKGLKKRVLAKLEIPANTLVFLGHEGSKGKCRAALAKVLSLHDKNGDLLNLKVAYSTYDDKFKYEVGKMVLPRATFNTSLIECTSGIHFYMTRAKAASYCK